MPITSHGPGDYGLSLHANGYNVLTMDLQRATTGLGRATTGLWRMIMDHARATTDRKSGIYVCARTHPYKPVVHLFLSTVDLGSTHRLYISYPIPTNKLRKKFVKFFSHANVYLKRTDGHGRPSICVLNGRPNTHVRLVRQPCTLVITLIQFKA